MQLQDLAPAAIALVVVAVVVAVGAKILTDFQDTLTANSTGYNATANALTGISNLTSWFGTIGTVIAAAVILGLIVGAFMLFTPRNEGY